ncbi:MAG TPA: PTS system mannose/fructose/sorbose family transporter subunit IID [Smithellaceae bacterium]|nr:PTS system mannose/fructose/sorbose family transporter subunit IID [Smithellaceae bacterium]
MNKNKLIQIFMRSLLIHAALNFRRMQNLGFAFTMIPLVKGSKLDPESASAVMTRHLQMFNTHPYLTAPVIGSVVSMEEASAFGQDAKAVLSVKQGLMGPYAAIGDTFFWGALRPCAGIAAAVAAFQGWIVAPLIFLLVYTPFHAWIRVGGFIEGYRKGKLGIEFIRKLNLPRLGVWIRWLSVGLLAGSCVWLFRPADYAALINVRAIVIHAAALAVILACVLMIRKGISQTYILYIAVVFFLILSMKEYVL